MKNMFESLDLTERAVHDIRSFLHSLPLIVVQHWDSSSPWPAINTGLLQFFPDDELRADEAFRLKTARMIAKAWGGEWTRTDKGQWNGRRQVAGYGPLGQECVLHDVELPTRGDKIDLSDPEPEVEAERDEAPATHTLEAAAVAEAREIEKYGMPEPWEGRP